MKIFIGSSLAILFWEYAAWIVDNLNRGREIFGGMQ